MINYQKNFYEYKEKGKKINVSLLGAGFMGKALVSQYIQSGVLNPLLISSRHIEDAIDAYLAAGIAREDIIKITSADEISDLNKYYICEDKELLYKSEHIDYVIDATGEPIVGTEISYNALMNGKNVITFNLESDVCVGTTLSKIAEEKGLIYTGIDGDEPGTVLELYNEAKIMGFDVLAIGKGKNNEVDLEANPDTVSESAKEKGIKKEMLASFVDGTKTMVEMATMSNATGFRVDVDGGHGIKSDIKSLDKKLCLKSEGGVLNSYGIVDYVNGIAPGVFVIVKSDLKKIDHLMRFLKMGEGPNYVLYRPYHLTSIETINTVLKAHFDKLEAIKPISEIPYSDVVAIAKKDMKKGEKLDYIGGYTFYGKCIDFEKSREKNLVPISVINEGTVLSRDIKKGENIDYNSVELDSETLVYKLRKEIEAKYEASRR